MVNPADSFILAFLFFHKYLKLSLLFYSQAIYYQKILFIIHLIRI